MRATLKTFLNEIIVPFLGYVFIRFIYLTCKKVYNIPQSNINDPFIAIFWHGELLMQPYLYKKLRANGKIALMISEHKDGEVLAKAMGFFGFETIRGSSRRGAIKVLKAAFSKVDLGYDLAITPDGPKGPRFSVADGVMAISQKKGVALVAFNCKPKDFWQLGSWDRFVIPKPFTTLHFFASDPFFVTSMGDEEAKALIKERLLEHAIV